MNKEKITKLSETLKLVKQEISALPESSTNGQLIDAEIHVKNAYTHLEQYLRISARAGQ